MLAAPMFAAKGAAAPAFLPERVAVPAPHRRDRRAGVGEAARVSLRIDHATHVRLTQAALRSGSTVSAALLAALADYIAAESAAIPGCACLKSAGGQP